MVQCISQRWILAMMMLIGLGIVFTTRMALSVTIIKMAPQNQEKAITNECPVDRLNARNNSNNGISEDIQYEFDWSPILQGYILSAVYIGMILFQIPTGILATRVNSKLFALCAVGTNSLLTLITPFCVRGNYAAVILIIIRITIGTAEASVLPVFAEMLIVWFPSTERTRCFSFVISGVQLGHFMGAAMSGYLLSAFDGWTSVYYAYGSIGMTWCILFSLLCYSSPDAHPFISDEEKRYLKETNKPRNKERPPIPWTDILTSLNVWATAFAQFSHMFASTLISTNLARYLTYVLKCPILESGLLSAFPFVVMCTVSIICGHVSDFIMNKSYMTRTNLRKCLGFICLICPSIAFIIAPYAECNKFVAVCCFVIGIALMGTFSSGIKVNSSDLSPNYVSLLMTLTNLVSISGCLISPSIAALMTPNSSLLEWKRVFWTNLIIAIPCAAFYSVCASGEV